MKRRSIVLVAIALAGGFAAPSLLAAVNVSLHNWPVPTAQRGGARAQGILADTGNPGVFVPMVPCRVVDTRNAVGPFGGPIMTGGSTRTFNIPTGPCTGIATFPAAYSLNFTVVDMAAAPGFLTTFPTGSSQPVVSTLDYVQSAFALANAAVVPAGTSSSINVFVSVTTDVIIDINGYYINSNSSINAGEFFGVFGAGAGVGGLAFSHNTSTSTSNATSAFRGQLSGAGNGGSAVLGEQLSTTGANFGARGNNSSTTANSAGVLGVAGTRTFTLSYRRAGVRGESATDLGVLGVTNTSGASAAVAGESLSSVPAVDFAGYLGNAFSALGVQYIGGLGGSGTKNFYEPHPTDPEKVIRYVALEGNEAGTYFRGRAVLEGGRAVITVPESFRMVTDGDGLTAQVTVMGRPTLIGVSSLDLNQVVVEGDRDVEFSYLVQGVRKAYKDFEVVAVHPFFRPRSPSDRMFTSLSPDEKARLIANGTYNADGTVNMDTAERLGWAQQWRDKARLDQETAAAAAAANAGRPANSP